MRRNVEALGFEIFIYVILNIRFVLQLCIYFNEVSKHNDLLLNY